MARRVIIAGGGIAGLAVAGGLRGLGWDVTIYEQAPSFAPVGAAITLAPNAVRALDWLGLGDELRSRSTAHGEVAIKDAAGRRLFRTGLDDLERRYGAPSFALHRADLHEMLAGAVDTNGLRTGHRITGVRSGSNGAVTFAGPDGPGEDSADLIIAADGVNSRIRGALFPEHPGPAYAGYVAWRGMVSAAAAPNGSLDAGPTETWGRGSRFGIVPLGDGQVYWYAAASLPAGSRDHNDGRDDLDELRIRHRDWHDPIPSLLAAASPDALLRHEIYHLRTALPRYAVGRVALIGDAAHAITPDLGQGGCLALEDAVTLIHVLSGEPSVPAALAAYDRARRPRTQRTVRVSALLGAVAQWHARPAVAARNTMARLTPPWLFLRASDATLGWRPPPPR